MKLIDSSYKIIAQSEKARHLRDGINKHIELCGRTCYKSTDLITQKSAKPFVDKMIMSKHFAMLEHGTVYLSIPLQFADIATKYERNAYSKVNNIGDTYYITTNLRVIEENKWHDDLGFMSPSCKQHEKRITVRFICNRQVSHEFVRHRVFSFAQESTRFCNYSKDKFGNELTFIKPCWYDEAKWYQKFALHAGLKAIELIYLMLIKTGWKPQQAATILPNATKTELIMTGYVSDWNHFFDLRARGITGAPHPQAKELAEPLAQDFLMFKF